MTTIAYRDGVLAGETLITAGNTKLPGRERKVFRLRNGCLFAAAGAIEQREILKRAIGDGSEPKLTNINAILIRVDGSVWTYEGNAWVKDNAPYLAIGSGSDYALGAMFMGADAKQAVRAGIALDKHSGGRVLSVTRRQPWLTTRKEIDGSSSRRNARAAPGAARGPQAQAVAAEQPDDRAEDAHHAGAYTGDR